MVRSVRWSVMALATALIVSVNLTAQDGQSDLSTLKDQITALQAEMKSLREQLQQLRTSLDDRKTADAPAPERIPDDLESDLSEVPIEGEPSARIVLIEFTDFQCPFCGRHARDTLSTIRRRFVETGTLKYAVRHFPLETLHPFAFRAAEAATCAADQGRFWNMHQLLFARQDALAPPDLLRDGELLRLNADRYQACLRGKNAPVVRRDLAEGLRLGVVSTPTSFLGIASGNTVRLRAKLVGAEPFQVFERAILALANEH